MMTKFRFGNSRWVRAIAAGVVVTALTACSSTDPRFEPAELTEYAPGISAQELWSVSLGKGGGVGFAPVWVNDAVYAATRNGNVAKLDLASGRVLWRTSLDTDLSAGVGSDGNVTAVATPEGQIIALDDAGQELWRARATSEVSIPPVVGQGVVVVRSGDYRIQAFDARTGDLLWNVQRPGPALALKANIQMIIIEGMVLSGLPNGKMIAIDIASGNVQWEGTVALSQGATDLERIVEVLGTPQIQGPLLCGVAYQGQITCFNVSQGGQPAWQQYFSSNTGIGSDQVHVYAADTRDTAQAFNLDTGAPAWKQNALRNRRLSAPAVVADGVAFGDYEGYIHFLSRSDGQLLGRIRVDGDPIVSPLLATPRGIVVQTSGGNLTLVGAN